MELTKILTVKPLDFDQKWNEWLKEIKDVKNHIEIVNEETTGYGKRISFYYDSVANTKIFAIMYLRLDSDKPTVIYYHGHNSYIEDPNNVWHAVNLLDAGYSVCAIDMRFQGDRVKDNNEYRYTNHPSVCYNIDDIDTCYSKRLDQDALKIIDIISDGNIFPNIKNRGIMLAGPSQGGGLSIMAAALTPHKILAVVSDVPSDCAIKDRILNREGKYGVILDFIQKHPNLKEKVLNNQDYFDCINMADKIKCPILFSVGTNDTICPPKYFYHAYEKITSEKELIKYEGYGHGGFEEIHLPKKITFLDKHIDK